MNMFATSALAITLTCTALVAGPASLAGGQSPKLPEKKAEKQVTHDDLRSMLEAMGYQPQPILTADGKPLGYSIRFDSDEFTLYAEITFSGNGRYLWVGGPYGREVDETAGTSGVLKLLELNDVIWPAYVTYLPKHKKFYVMHATPTASLTPAALRAAVETYAKSMKAVIKTWDNGQSLARKGD
jgi:hypothetical protein